MQSSTSCELTYIIVHRIDVTTGIFSNKRWRRGLFPAWSYRLLAWACFAVEPLELDGVRTVEGFLKLVTGTTLSVLDPKQAYRCDRPMSRDFNSVFQK